MKNMKKLASLLLVMVMVLSLTAAAFADETTPHTITIRNSHEGHTYKAYQIFEGTVETTEGDTVGKLTNINWGKGVNGEVLLAALKGLADGAYNSCKTAEDVANKLKERTDDAGQANRVNVFAEVVNACGCLKDGGAYTSNYDTTNKNYVISVIGDGYYFVKDTDIEGIQEDAVTKYMLRVARNVNIAPKYALPSFEKKVQDSNDSFGETPNWQDSADYDIGDSVPFLLKGTVPTDYYNDYKAYKFVFHDTLSNGLTFQSDSVEVKVDGKQISSGYEVNTNPGDGHSFDVTFDNLKDISDVHASSEITVEYKATLNTNAVIGVAGNPNTARLEFSNNPYSEDGSDTGKTPEDKVVVFTYQMIVYKEGPSGNPLKGAEFTLEKFEQATNKWVTVTNRVINTDDAEESKQGTIFTFKGLDDGKYRLKETKTPNGYNSISDTEFTITATHNLVDPDPKLLTLTTDDNDITADMTDGKLNGSLSTHVQNQAGTTLPTTGGIGTTLFYVIGSVLVLAAVVLLVTKKRMNAQN